MLKKALTGSAVLSAAILLSACYDNVLYENPSLYPSDYSPDYTYVTKVSENGRTKRVLVPEACLTADTPSPANVGPERLPPGCANNYNLQRMVEDKRDLKRGRKLSPAPAAPAARAAQDYLDGGPEDKSRIVGGGFREGGGFIGDAPAVEPQPQAQ